MCLTQRLRLSQVNHRWRASASASRRVFSQVSHFRNKPWCKVLVTVRGGQHGWHRLTGVYVSIRSPSGSPLPGHLGHYHSVQAHQRHRCPLGLTRASELLGSQTLALENCTIENLCCPKKSPLELWKPAWGPWVRLERVSLGFLILLLPASGQ